MFYLLPNSTEKQFNRTRFTYKLEHQRSKTLQQAFSRLRSSKAVKMDLSIKNKDSITMGIVKHEGSRRDRADATPARAQGGANRL